MFIGDNLVS
jgi:hypothetical protein